MKPYVIVRHKPTGRAFSLNRDYSLLNLDLGIIEAPTKYVEDWDEWLPSFNYQRPAWVNEMEGDIAHNFYAYWLY